MKIRNCTFRYKCTKEWDSLTKTENELIRYCEVCDRGVHHCKDEKELLEAMANNWCVAIQITTSETESVIDMPQYLLGKIATLIRD